jgi:ATP-dependent helicase/nuclease subunit B
MRLLEELQKMEQAAAGEKQSMTWLEFRSWLGRSLERYDFKPATPAQPVVLMELAKTLPGRFDALVIASAEREQMPGAAPGTPFFNDAVRLELGLPVADELLAVRFYHFRRLLEAAPTLLITHCVQRNGEEVLASPWLELLHAFHKLAYRNTPDDLQLKQLLHQEESAVVHRRPLPRQIEMPRPSLPPELLPKRYSASAYQQLMDCPYQFFAARGLGLAPPDVIREALEKSDYGERVHRCLQALHGDIDKLPGPFKGNWEARRRDEAIALLEQISDAVFARDLEDNFLHRGWLQRWKRRIPEYIDWQLQRAEQWQVAAVEQQLQEEQAVAGLILHGRLDRCDTNGTQQAIIDYKTGSYADTESVSSGEAVQLPYYALLATSSEPPVTRVEYLSLDAAKISGRTILEGDELEALRHQVGNRLGTLHKEMLAAAELPAWGTEEICGYCRFSGICRRAVWLEK